MWTQERRAVRVENAALPTPVSCICREIPFPGVALPTSLWAEGVSWLPFLSHKSGWQRKDLAFSASAFGGGREGVGNRWPKHLLQLTSSLYFSLWLLLCLQTAASDDSLPGSGTDTEKVTTVAADTSYWAWKSWVPRLATRKVISSCVLVNGAGSFKSLWNLPRAPQNCASWRIEG